jgi:hypothetical protein
MLNPEQIKALVNNGLIFTKHAKDKLIKERISILEVKEVLLSGLNSTCDNSIRNDKTFAWNNSTHNTITYKGLTVVFCDSKEHACLIVSLYHGTPHNYMSNPLNAKTQGIHNYNLNNSRIKIFR